MLSQPPEQANQDTVFLQVLQFRTVEYRTTNCNDMSYMRFLQSKPHTSLAAENK